MSKYGYKEIKQKVSLINNRILNFISEKDEIDNIIDSLEINKPPLDHWITSDYVKLNGSTYIDEFLELYSHTLDQLEIEILEQKLRSHISLFKVVNIKYNKVYIEDQLDDSMAYTVTDDMAVGLLREGDYVLARTSKIGGQYIFIGDVEYIPSSIIDKLYENILIFFNRARMDKPDLDIKDYLKMYSLDIYSIYRECLSFHVDDIEDDMPPIITDISDFQDYAIDNFPKDYHIYITNLMEIFEYSLMEKELSLQDINKIDIDGFFKDAIRDGFISSKEDYNSYLETLKTYLVFLGPSNPDYKETYNRVVEISNNRFKYMNKLKDTNFDYEYDKMLVSTISDRLSTDALNFVGDLDRFLIFVMEFEIGLTPKRKEIQKKELLSINKLLKLSYPFISSRPRQVDSRIIELFYHMSLDLGLTIIDGKKMVITDKGKNFFKLKDEEKYAIAFSYIWRKDFIKELSLPKTVSVNLEDNLIDRFLSLEHSNLEELIKDISDDKTKKVIIATGFIRYLMLIDLVKYDKDFDVHFTSLGKLIYKYMLSIKNNKSGVVSFKDYKEKRTKEG